MAVDVNIQPIGSGFNRTIINTNFEAIDEALQDALSRSGKSPNVMGADIDLNGNDLINVSRVEANTVVVDGEEFLPSSVIAKGDKGDSATITVGTVTTGNAGTSVIITNSGTTSDAVFNFTIPKGDTGASGAGSGDMVAAQNLNDVADKPTSFNTIKQAATDSYTGVVELATSAETITGTDTTRATTPAGVAAAVDSGSGVVLLASGSVSGSSLTIDLSSYTDYFSFRMEFSNLSPTSLGRLGVRLGNGGIDSGPSDYTYNRIDGYSSSGSASVSNENSADAMMITANNAFSSQADVEINITNPLIGKRGIIRGVFTGKIATDVMAFSQFWGSRRVDKVIDTFRIYPTAGTFNTGTYRLYGYK